MTKASEVLRASLKSRSGKVILKREAVATSSSQPKIGASPVVDLDAPSAKRARVTEPDGVRTSKSSGKRPAGVEEDDSEASFLKLPYVWSKADKYGPGVTCCLGDSDLKIIKDLGPAGRSQAISEGVVAMMKAIGVAIAINNECVEEAVLHGVVEKDRDELASKVLKLEGDLSACKEEHDREVEEKDEKIKTLTDQVKNLQQTVREQTGKIKALEEEYAPGEIERADLKVLNRAALIEALDGAEGALATLARETFENALAQVQAANPGMQLVTEGLHFMKEVVDGVVVTPPDFEDLLAGLPEGDAGVGSGQIEGEGKAGDA